MQKVSDTGSGLHLQDPNAIRRSVKTSLLGGRMIGWLGDDRWKCREKAFDIVGKGV